MNPIAVAFLDRDGTINVDDGYVHRVDQWQFLPRAIDGLAALRTAGFRLAVVTNQSGIGRGFYGVEEVDVLHRWLQSELRRTGVEIDVFAFCPHTPEDNCDCRKPRTGLAQDVSDRLGAAIDMSASWMIGDKISDIEFGRCIGVKTALIRSPSWQTSELPFAPDLIVSSLFEAATLITRRVKPPTDS